MKSVFLCLSMSLICLLSQAQTENKVDKVQYQSIRGGIDFNTNYGGLNYGSLTRVYIGYHIDQSKKFGISPFFNLGANLLQNLKPDTFGVRLGFEPGLLTGYQNDHIGIKLLTSVNLVFANSFSNGLLVEPCIGINIGSGRKPLNDNLVISGYLAMSPSFQGGATSLIIGGNIGYRMRPITYVKEF